MKHFFLIIPFALFFESATVAQHAPDTVCILQLNDVYEIGPLDQGRVGGMARVATLVKQHESRYQTFVVMAGDFVSPSVIGTTKIDKERVNGRHMVDIMNKTGVDLVTFGNHEFDIPEKDLQQRINESQFAWVSSDVMHKDSNGYSSPFYKTSTDSTMIPKSFLLSSAQGQFTIGIISATIPSNKQAWVEYRDHLQSMKKACKELKRLAGIIVALTHLDIKEDRIVLHKLKRIRLIMGGHEHRNSYETIRKAAIAKADANAKTLYRHLVFREGKRGKIKIVSELIRVDAAIQPDPVINDAVKEWELKAYAAFREIGLEPGAVVYHTIEPLDGTEASVRYKQTNLGGLVAQSMLFASPQAAAAIFNSGSIRIDDMIEGVVTQLDIIRALPFGGKLCEVELSGNLLNQLLKKSDSLKGDGGYLQRSDNLNLDGKEWVLNGTPINALQTYKIVSPEFLFSGAQTGLEFLKEGNPEIKGVKRFTAAGDIHTDLRLAVVKYLAELKDK